MQIYFYVQSLPIYSANNWYNKIRIISIIYNELNRTNGDYKRELLLLNTPSIDRKIEMLCHSYLLSLNEEYCDLGRSEQDLISEDVGS